MEVRMKPGHWPDIAKMEQTIRDSGYTPFDDGVELIVTGVVARKDGRLVLELDRMRTARTLEVAAAKDDPDTAAHLERHVGDLVEVEGEWLPEGEGRIAVTAIYGAEDPKPKRR
jgi:hypothetical protein